MQTIRDVTVVRHREYVSDVYGHTDFTLMAYRINAANSNLFPWLSAVAQGYESYQFRTLKFTYIPACATSEEGTTVFAVDYDPIDDSPTSKMVLKNMSGAVSDNVYEKLDLVVSGDSSSTLGKRRFTLVDDPYNDNSVVYPPNGDPKTYDVGYLNVAVTGRSDAAATALGELYVEYTVELHTPQLIVHNAYEESAKVSNGPNPTPTKILGDAAAVLGKGLRNEAIQYLSNCAMIPLKKGCQMLISSALSLGDTGIGLAPTAQIVNSAGAEIKEATIHPNFSTGYAGGGLDSQWVVKTNSTGDEPYFRFGIPTYGSTVTSADLRFAPYLAAWS